jgi:glycosyltransferase involved in cell wall biosynthesis
VYVASRPPYPLDEGLAIRQFHLMKAYARLGDVRLVFFHADERRVPGLEALGEYCASVHPVWAGSTFGQGEFLRLSWVRQRRRHMLTARPYAATLAFSAEMRRIIEEVARGADLIHVCRLHMVPHVQGLFARGADRPRLVLDLDEVESVASARRLKVDRPGQGALTALSGYYDIARLWLYQRRAVGWFDRTFVCSSRDRDRLGRATVVAVPNGATLSAKTGGLSRDPATILYCGSLSYRANVNALVLFVQRILPLIRREVPDARLLVVGRQPTEEVRALHDGKSIWVHGDVPDVEEYYGRSTLLAVPLAEGGGTRIKILEAFAAGTPVVSTSLGCEGLEVADGEHLLIADEPAAFADACVSVLRRPELGARLAVRGRSLVEERYTWERIESQVAGIATELLASPGNGRVFARG